MVPPSHSLAAIQFDRFRSHAHLLEARRSLPTEERIRFRATTGAGQYVVGEMPRGLSSYQIHLGLNVTDFTALEWQPFGGGATRVLFTESEPLQLRMSSGTRLRLHWQAQDFQFLRVQALRWVAGESGVRPVALPEIRFPNTVDREWFVPDDWLGHDPLEVRLTPLLEDRQGLTERLILPPRHLRIETVFQRVMLTLGGERVRRLRVEVRVPPPLQPPLGLRIDWQPYDVGVQPASFPMKWAPGATSAAVTLQNISLRGDRVRVQFERGTDQEQEFAWFAADESGYGSPPPDVLLTAGRGPTFEQFEFVHTNTFPRGEPAHLLIETKPWLSVPALDEFARGSSGEAWPTTLLANYGALIADRARWDDLRRTFGAMTADVGEFARLPQLYLQYDREPELRALARRCGIAGAPFIVEQLQRAWSDAANSTDREALARHWLSARDGELECWLHAAAAGASIERLRSFWFLRQWTSPPREILQVSWQLERNAEQPLAALVPELIPGTFMAGELQRAVAAENRLLQTTATPADFAAAALLRKTVLTTLADQWSRLLTADAEDRLRDITTSLALAPARAAAQLSALRGLTEPLRLTPGPWLVFVVEREMAYLHLRLRTERDFLLRTALDWCRTLLEQRIVPPWPWLGLLPGAESSQSVWTRWEQTQAQLPLNPPDSHPPRPDLQDALRSLQDAAVEVQDAKLQALATGGHAAVCAGE